jgi:hypothetical protein
MYGGSPPGLAQVHSPYKQAIHQSPPEVGSPQQQSIPAYAQMPQAFSPHRTGPTNVMSPGHQGKTCIKIIDRASIQTKYETNIHYLDQTSLINKMSIIMANIFF